MCYHDTCSALQNPVFKRNAHPHFLCKPPIGLPLLLSGMKNIALIGNYAPRLCGIATFTKDLNESLMAAGHQTMVLAMNDGAAAYNYPDEVVLSIAQNELSQYRQAARFLNESTASVVCLQHEYGIFGGDCGEHILHLLRRLRMPVVTTLHTVLDEPSAQQKMVLQQICALSQKVVTMSRLGVQFLIDIYGVDPAKIVHIHHGIHPLDHIDAVAARAELGLPNKTLLLTFGLLSRNKSIETVLDALPEIITHHPSLLYIVLGATHPHVRAHSGEEYREFLMQRTRELGLENHVLFVDRFATNEELFKFLRACDVYVIPYQSPKQITSGTLVYAMGSQSAIVSTPFWYASEMLENDRGLLFPFGDAAMLASQIRQLLDDQQMLKNYQERAQAFAETALWPNVALKYAQSFYDASTEWNASRTDVSAQDLAHKEILDSLPPLVLGHLHTLSDDTGILQHARYSVPDRRHGYCSDDNARALLLSVLAEKVTDDKESLLRLQSRYLSFLDHAFNETLVGFRNFMSYGRDWLDDMGSEDCQGRCMWGLGVAAAQCSHTGHRGLAHSLFHQALPMVNTLTHPRAIAYAMLGLVAYCEEYPQEIRVKKALTTLGEKLIALFAPRINDAVWPWHDDKVTYGNSRVPQAMLLAGDVLAHPQLIAYGTKLIDWLIKQQFVGNTFSPIGNQGWLTKQGKARYDQQPLEAHGMMDACFAAAGITGQTQYIRYGQQSFNWYLGDNDGERALYDFETGACMDGLHPQGVNLNQGAESTLSWLISLTTMHRISLPTHWKTALPHAHSKA